MTEQQEKDLIEKVEKLSGILEAYEKAEDKYNRDGFRSRHPELEEYSHILGSIAGKDDYDVYTDAYDEFHTGNFGEDEEAYVTQCLVPSIKKKLDELRSIFDIPKDEPVQVVDEGEDEIEAEEKEDVEKEDGSESEEQLEKEEQLDEIEADLKARRKDLKR